MAGSAWSWLKWFLHDQAAIWITALATAFLYRATSLLTRATNVEHALNGPFLSCTLTVEPQPAAAVNPLTATYRDDWGRADTDYVPLADRNRTATARYVMVAVQNGQTRPQGAASDVTVTAVLYFGAADDMAPHPYHIERVIGPMLLPAGNSGSGPLFNVGGIPNFEVHLRKVGYRDIMNRSRTSAVGTGIIKCIVAGVITTFPRVFEPRKGEFTDGD
jgi:hypothetical protein